MLIDSSTAAVDTDFIIKVANIDRPRDKMLNILREVFGGIGINAIMHPLVYKNELKSQNSNILAIFENGVVERPTLEDIFQESAEKEEYYRYLVPELFKALNGNELPIDDIMTSWVAGRSLGEIHSAAMCIICGCGLFLSDDQDSKSLKRIIDMKAMGTIEVYNRNEVIEKYIAKGNNSLPRNERRAFTHR